MTEHYAIYGDLRSEQKRARDCIAGVYDEAVLLDTRLTGERFAEVVLARLAALYPPMLVVALEEPTVESEVRDLPSDLATQIAEGRAHPERLVRREQPDENEQARVLPGDAVGAQTVLEDVEADDEDNSGGARGAGTDEAPAQREMGERVESTHLHYRPFSDLSRKLDEHPNAEKLRAESDEAPD